MSPTPEELELGWKAHRGVYAYETDGMRNMRRLPLVLAVCFFVPSLLAFFSHRHSHDFTYLAFYFMALSLGAWVRNRMEKEAYADRKLLLRLLKEKYGDELPWVVEEKQLSAANELEMKIAQEQVQPNHA